MPANGNNRAWTSYKYYRGTGSVDSQTNTIDYMWSQDIEEGGEKYRGVYFTSYRPYWTYYVSNTSDSYQDNHGYYINNVYWFKYEDIVWDVGKNENAEVTLISHTILDSRKFYIASGETRIINSATVDTNNYEHSTIRAWLNGTFYNTSFATAKEQNTILLREVDNSAATTNTTPNTYASNNTNDKIFLLSFKDIDENFATYNITTIKQGSDYAKSQGLYVVNFENSYYWLRSPFDASGLSCRVNQMGTARDDTVVNASYGTLVALKIGL